MRYLLFITFFLNIACAITISACAASSSGTGELDHSQIDDLRRKVYSEKNQPAEIKNPEDKIVIIYNHGTTCPQSVEDCSADRDKIPNSLLFIQTDQILIYYLCSKAKESYAQNEAGKYVYLRLREVKKILDGFLSLGVQPGNIFLAGHSAGGWVSLMASHKYGHKFNAAIVFAPAFSGPRSQIKKFPWWRKVVRPRQIKEMLKAPEVKALVFAYVDDPFNRPEDLAFLTEHYPDSVRMVAYKCSSKNVHRTHLNDCREAETTRTILNYIKEMTGRKLN